MAECFLTVYTALNSKRIAVLLQVWMAGENHSQAGITSSDGSVWAEVS